MSRTQQASRLRATTALQRLGSFGSTLVVATFGLGTAAVPLAPAAAQTTSLVNACSGVSLPRSVVTDITGQVLTPVIGGLESTLRTLTVGTVNLGLSGALSNAAAGQPITLNALDVNGNVVNLATTTNCVSQSDSYTIKNQGGLSIGGNSISGLGTSGRLATAGALTAIAIGDDATTGTGLLGAIAIGEGASVTGGTASIALGKGSVATGVGLLTPGYLVGGTATSELAIGGRRITGVAAGAADTDAVNVAQLRAATTGTLVDSLAYDVNTTAFDASRGGSARRITGVAPGAVNAGSSDAVNGSQLSATNDQVAANGAAITGTTTRVGTLETNVAGLQADALLYNGSGAYSASRNGSATRITGVAAGAVNATSSDAVNGAQLSATNDQVTANTSAIAGNTTRLGTLEGNVSGLQADALLYNGSNAYSASRNGSATKVTGVAAGAVNATSSDAVNGAQLSATNDRVTANTTAIGSAATRVGTLETNVAGLQADALLYNGTAYSAARTGVATRLTGIAAGAVNATSSDAVTGAQLSATNDQVAANTSQTAANTGNITTLQTNVSGLQANALLYNGTAYSAAHNGVAAKITNVANGTVSATSKDAVNGSQLQATNDVVAANTSAISGANANITGLQQNALLFDGSTFSAARNGAATKITNVAAGTVNATSRDAVNGAQLSAVADQVANTQNSLTNLNTTVSALNSDGLRYDSVTGAYNASRLGVPTKLTGIANGAVNALSRDAVNGSQLSATNDQVALHTTAIGGLTSNVTVLQGNVGTLQATTAGLQANALLFDGASFDASRGGAPKRITNLAAGAVTATSRDAVTGAQLSATNDQLAATTAASATNTANVTSLQANVAGLRADALLFDGASNAFSASRGGAATRLTNLADGTVAPGSRDAVTGSQLAATEGRVAANTAAVGQLGTDLAGLDAVAVRYDDGSRATATLGGAGGTRLANVSAGVNATDAVNVAQLAAVAQTVNGLSTDALAYDANAAAYSARRNGVVQKVTGVAPATLDATSSDAVNGSQLYATNQTVAGNTGSITTLSTRLDTLGTSVTLGQVGPIRYSTAAAPTTPSLIGPSQDVTLVGVAAAPVRLHNLGAGRLASDSLDGVNGTQLFGLGNSVASVLGGGSAFDTNSGLLAGNFNFGGNSYGNVQDALSAVELSIGNISGSGGSNNFAGTRYFRTTSVAADSQAAGVDSTAIGPNAVAMGTASLAAGQNAWAQDEGSVAIGQSAQAARGKAVSIGYANVASGNGAVAIGDPNIVSGDGAVALGRDNQATGDGSVALGDTNLVVGGGAVALGAANQVTGIAAVGLGMNNVVTGDSSIALGSNNRVNGAGSFAFGTNNVISGNESLAIGQDVQTSGLDTLAIGNGSGAQGAAAAAYGNRAFAAGLGATALGTDSRVTGVFSVAVGDNARVNSVASIAIGQDASVSQDGSIAIGAGARTDNEGSIALGGAAATTRGGLSNYNAFGLDAPQTSQGELAIARNIPYTAPDGTVVPTGERQITGVAAGSADTDAVNVAQLRGATGQVGAGLANALGGGASYDATTGAFSGPGYTIGGVTYSNVGAALSAVGGTAASAGAAAANAVSYDGPGFSSVTLGGAGGTRLTNVAAGAVASGSTDAINGSQLFAVQQGLNDVAARLSAGGGIPAPASSPLAYSDVALGSTISNDVSLVGAQAGQAVGLHNVADGAVAAGSTDAVNGGQLYAVQQTAGNAVQYDRNADGSRASRVTLGGSEPVTIGNVAAGVKATDAVNVGQLNASIDTAIATSNAYTDQKVGELRSSMKSLRRDGQGGTAAAMAMSSVPQAYGPGMGVVGMGVGAWGGESAIAIGASKATPDGSFVLKAGATYNSRGDGGGAIGAGFAF